MNYIPSSGWTVLDGEYLHLGDVFWWCFAWTAHHIRKLNIWMPLLEKKDFIWISGWSGFACGHHTLFLNDGTSWNLQTCFHDLIVTDWSIQTSAHQPQVAEENAAQESISCLDKDAFHPHSSLQFFFTQSISIHSIVQLKIFSLPLGLKG